jgi:hypothetical protein
MAIKLLLVIVVALIYIGIVFFIFPRFEVEWEGLAQLRRCDWSKNLVS